jgi:hypothetical protein
MGSPCTPLCDIALTSNLLWLDEISGRADVVLAQLANPVLVLSALPNTDTVEVDPNICLQAGMQGRTASMCNPEAAGYETRILQPIAYRIPGYVSDTDTRWIRLGYVSVEYPEKNKCR